jgi:hypothetical protein
VVRPDQGVDGAFNLHELSFKIVKTWFKDIVTDFNLQ